MLAVLVIGLVLATGARSGRARRSGAAESAADARARRADRLALGDERGAAAPSPPRATTPARVVRLRGTSAVVVEVDVRVGAFGRPGGPRPRCARVRRRLPGC